jgi:hypothetical protein
MVFAIRFYSECQREKHKAEILKTNRMLIDKLNNVNDRNDDFWQARDFTDENASGFIMTQYRQISK